MLNTKLDDLPAETRALLQQTIDKSSQELFGGHPPDRIEFCECVDPRYGYMLMYYGGQRWGISFEVN